MKKHKFYLSCLLVFFLLISSILLSSCCRSDKIYAHEGRELYDEELKVIPYEEGDTIKFESNNEIHEFICSYRNHSYNKGQASYISHNECEGQRLMSQDRLSVKIKTDLTTFYYQNSKINQVDSMEIKLGVNSDYDEEKLSAFGFSMQGPFYGSALLKIVDNDVLFQEDIKPSYNYNTFNYYNTLKINNVIYNEVICIENGYPLYEGLPFFYSKLYYNEEFGIIQLTRSDGIIYDLVQNK